MGLFVYFCKQNAHGPDARYALQGPMWGCRPGVQNMYEYA